MDLAAVRTSELTIRAVSTMAVSVPLNFALGTSAAVVREAPILLVNLQTEEGIEGRCYLFGYTSSGVTAIAGHLREVVELVKGHKAAPRSIASMLARRFALLGVTGTVRMALSALDVALWDALAISLGLPLVTLLGAQCRPVPAYDSSGLGLMPPERAADEAEALLGRGFKAIKLRLGHATLGEDLLVTRAVRRRVADDVVIMVDYNQALSVAESIARGGALQHEGVYWLEEPTRHDDYRGNAAIARAVDVPLQIGENFNGPTAMLEALDTEACDYVMPDLARIGGVTGWIEAAALAASYGVEMSSHMYPEVSAHLLAATPTGRWIEYFDWSNAILEEPLKIVEGNVVTPDRPGHGMVWDRAKLARLQTI